jgi:hypothetical protein
VSTYGDFGSITLGRLTLREALSAASETGGGSGRTMKLSGQEAVPALTSAQLTQVQDDLPGSIGSMLPVAFTQKTDRDGYWILSDAQADLMNWNGELVTCTWQATLQRVGSDTEVDLESRLSGSLARSNAYSAIGERVHCPPIGHYGYYTGSTLPSVLVRTGSDGAMFVYRGVPTDVNPRWGCAVSTYLAGRVRFLDAHNLERAGTAFPVRPLFAALTPAEDLTPSSTTIPAAGAATVWTLHNTLVKITPATAGTGTLVISAWTGGGWRDKTWDVLIGGVSLGTPDTITVLRNEPEIVVVRLLRSQSPGRATIDLTLRRGHRAVEVYVQAASSATVKLVLTSAETGTAAAGYVTASGNDGAGNRYVIGSASLFTADTTNGGISATSTTVLDAFIGIQAGGASAVPGDTAADLFAAYIAAPSETVQAVRR